MLMRMTRSLLFPPLAACVSLLLVFALSLFFMHRHQETTAAQHAGETLDSSFNHLQQKEGEILAILLETIAHKEFLKSLFLSGNRSGLLAKTAPLLQRFQDQYNITHFYFSGKTRVNFLRVHAPRRHGDIINRPTTLQAARMDKMVHGIELGPLGTLTLRAVMPWYHQGKRIGFVELGKEVGVLLEEIKRIHGFDLHVLLKKRYLNQALWQTGLVMLGRSSQWDRYPDWVFTGGTTAELPQEVDDFLRAKKPLSSLFATIWEPSSHFFTYPLKDNTNRIVGKVIGGLDHRRVIAVNKSHMIAVLLSFLVITGLLLWILYKRQQVAQKFSENQELTESILSAVADPLVVFLKGTIRKVNPAICQLLGYPEHELLGMPVSRVFTTEIIFNETWLTALVTAGTIHNVDAGLTTKDGQHIPALISGSVIRTKDGLSPGIVLVAKDMTSHKKVEEARHVIHALLKLSLVPQALTTLLKQALALFLGLSWLAVKGKGAIFLTGEKRQHLHLIAHAGFPDHQLRRCSRVALGECLCGRAASSEEILFADHVDGCHDFQYAGLVQHGHYVVPMVLEGELLGVVTLYLEEGHPRSDQ